MKQISYLQVYKNLRNFFKPENTNWYQTLLGADFWLDGFDILYNSNPEKVQILLEGLENKGFQKDNFEDFSLALDFWEEQKKHFEEVDFLATGFSLCEAFGGTPKLWPCQIGVVNDTLAFLTSPSYRSIRIHAYNSGVKFLFVKDNREYLFRPDLRYFVVPQNFYVSDLKPERAQFYSISHELIHFWGFGDLYQGLHHSKDYTSYLLVNAEESCCSFDLSILKEFSQYNCTQNLVDEFCQIDTGIKNTQKKKLLENCKDSEKEQRDLEFSLKKRALSYLSEKNKYHFKEKISLPRSDLWIGDLALKGHAEKTEEYVNYLSHSIREAYSFLLGTNQKQKEFCRKIFL